jgi:hypothetical protein
MFDEDDSPVDRCRRIYTKFSIISFIFCARDFVKNIINRFPAPSYLFSSPMGCYKA